MKKYLAIGIVMAVVFIVTVAYLVITKTALPWQKYTHIPEGAYLIITIDMFIKAYRKKSIKV